MKQGYLFVLFALASVVIVGCGDAGSPAANDSRAVNGSVELPRLSDGSVDVDAVREASNVSQCVKTTLGPCPCSSGGQPIAVNEKYVSALASERGNATACPQVYWCTDAEPRLVNGSCSLTG